MEAVGVLLSLPVRLVRAPVSVIFCMIRRKMYRSYDMPVSGLDDATAQSLHFALHRAASSSEEEEVASAWLRSLQVIQVAHMRVISELVNIERNLRFWSHRMESGSHFWFALFRHGPKGFVSQIARLFRFWRQDTSIQVHGERYESEVELAEKRVLILRVLQSQLCEALAAIQHSASLLYLQNHDEEKDEHIVDEKGIFQMAEVAILKSMKNLLSGLVTLQLAVESTVNLQQDSRGPASRDRPLLSQAVGSVLGLTHIRRIWSRHDVVHASDLQLERTHSSIHRRAPEGLHVDMSEDDIKNIATVSNAIELCQKAIGFSAFLVNPTTTVHDSLKEARRAAYTLQRTSKIVDLPQWILMPSQLEQHWISYSGAGVIVIYTSVFIFKHSRLNGSKDLENWIKFAIDSVKNIWSERVIDPLQKVKGELFDTFRRRPAIVSMEDWKSDRDSLQRMLNDFRMDYSKKSASSSMKQNETSASNEISDVGQLSSSEAEIAAQGLDTDTKALQDIEALDSLSDAQLLEGMQIMMHSYEKELKNPIRNLVTGNLMRSLLIQVQKLKVDTESAMLEIDQILKANELNISLLAAVPAFLIGGSVLVGFGRMLAPSPPDPRREALPARIAMIDAERALETLEGAEKSFELMHDENSRKSLSHAEGMVAFRLAQAYAEAEILFNAHKGVLYTSTRDEWAQLRGDLLGLAAPGPVLDKLRKCARMRSTYSIYQQF